MVTEIESRNTLIYDCHIYQDTDKLAELKEYYELTVTDVMQIVHIEASKPGAFLE